MSVVFSAAHGIYFCEQICESVTVNDIARGMGMNKTTIYGWLRQSERGNKLFEFEWLSVMDQLFEHYNHARIIQADILAEDIHTAVAKNREEIFFMDQKSASNVNQALRSTIDYTKWRTSTLNPNRYGKKSDQAEISPISVHINLDGQDPMTKSIGIKDVGRNNMTAPQGGIKHIHGEEVLPEGSTVTIEALPPVE